MNVTVLIYMSHPANLNESNKDFCHYLAKDVVLLASVGHKFLICCQF